MQVQVLSCPKKQSTRQVRIVLNDAPVPLNGINNCGEDEEGLCAFDTFVNGVQTLVDETDFAEACGSKADAEEVEEMPTEELEEAAEEQVEGEQEDAGDQTEGETEDSEASEDR